MIQEQHKRPLRMRIEKLKNKIRHGSLPALVSSSIVLAAFSSLIELPCTAGFPIIYAGILAGHYAKYSLGSYLYLLLYNSVYVLPLVVVIGVIGWTFHGKQISKKLMSVIKLIGGLIMIALGIVLLVNPGILMG